MPWSIPRFILEEGLRLQCRLEHFVQSIFKPKEQKQKSKMAATAAICCVFATWDWF